jgi:5-oxoprolinase (ATP-hydrolysing)
VTTKEIQATSWNVAVDTGGTFTDLVARLPDGSQVVFKTPSTPHDPSAAIVTGVEALRKRYPACRDTHLAQLRHGTTVGTNAVLEGGKTKVVMVLSEGFRDILSLRRQNRPNLYALHPTLPALLVPSEQNISIRGRFDPWGKEITPLEDLARWYAKHQAILTSAEAIGISLMHAYVNEEHEARVMAFLEQQVDCPITRSSAWVPVEREYERSETVAVNAYLMPIMDHYLKRLAKAFPGTEIHVMDSAGGLRPIDRILREPVQTVLSGPAGGVRGAWECGRKFGFEHILAFDMGGTSTDVCTLSGQLRAVDDALLGSHPLRIPLLPIETIGAGGGSIAYCDAAGLLQLGPRSAGALPGPACYGKAGSDAEPTLTDAHVVLGRVTSLLGGQWPLQPELARQAIARVARALTASVEDTAKAICALAESKMARAIKRTSLQRGFDPRDLVMVAFGGAGGLHACTLAEDLGMRGVIFPENPGALSAQGILGAPYQSTLSRCINLPESQWDQGKASKVLKDIAAEIEETYNREHPTQEPDIELWADCRYRGQSFHLSLDISDLRNTPASSLRQTLVERFEQAHTLNYGYTLSREHPLEWVNIRAFMRSPMHEQETLPQDLTPSWTQGPKSIACYTGTLWLPDSWRACKLDAGAWWCESLPDAIKLKPRHQSMNLNLEIHRERLAAITEEMGVALMRSSFSANIKERRDFSCALFDAQGRMLVQAAHIPVHLGSQQMSVEAAINNVKMKRGDTVLLNDPYAGGTHLPDVTLVSPVFIGEQKQASYYVSNRAHHADIGGRSAGSMPSSRTADGAQHTLSIEDEGFRSGPALLDDDLRQRFTQSSRTPNERMGDLRAQEAALHVGKKRLAQLASFLNPQLDNALLDDSQQRMISILKELPQGVYTFEDYLDDDGLGHQPLALPLTLTLKGEQAIVDFRAAPSQVASSLNAVRAITLSAVFYVFRCLGGEELSANEGLLRPITLLTRPGTICDATYPAAVSAGNVETSQRLVDVLWGALAQAAPARMPAASCGSMNNILFGGLDYRHSPDNPQPFVHYETLAGGAGAGPLGPGAHGVHTHMTNTFNTPVEVLERQFPVRIEEYRLRDAETLTSNGYCGGRGVVRVYTFLSDVEVTLITERRRLSPWSLGEGMSQGAKGVNILWRGGMHQGQPEILDGKVTLTLRCGDTLALHTPGGGHYSSFSSA